MLFDRYGADREALLAALVEERGLVPVHPYDDERVMAGQGTATLELLEDAGPLDVLLVPVGGGGLLSGCATAAARAVARTRAMIGVEPEAGDDFKRSLAAGERVRIEVPRTIADGQQLPMPGELTFPVIQQARRRGRHGHRRRDRRRHAAAVRAREDRRRAERRVRVRRAARGQGRRAGQRVGVILSGGNVTAERFAELVADRRGARACTRLRRAARGLERADRDGKDTHATTAVALIAGALVFAVPAALTWRIEAEAWPYIAPRAALELAYFALLAAVYRAPTTRSRIPSRAGRRR